MNISTAEQKQGVLRIHLNPACNHVDGLVPWYNNHLDLVGGWILLSPDLTEPEKWPAGPSHGNAPPADAGSGTLHKLFQHVASYVNNSFGGPPHLDLGGLSQHLLTLNRQWHHYRKEGCDDLGGFLRREAVAVALTQFCDAAASLATVLKIQGGLEFPFDRKSRYELGSMRFNQQGAAHGTLELCIDPHYKVITGFTLVMEEEVQPMMFAISSMSSISSLYSSNPSSSNG
jgi:hypothetical protein